uniref:Uncharacterized protein n=1 Tax=Lotus japonicus TaxID=34305 RepID=I3SU93_LOTJA|nr:unknown [Lotus japonicus]
MKSVEAGQVVNLRRNGVKKNSSDAVLRDVPEVETDGPMFDSEAPIATKLPFKSWYCHHGRSGGGRMSWRARKRN